MAGLAKVQSNGQEGNSASPALAFSSNVTSGNQLIAWLGWFAGGGLGGTPISDTVGSTWAQIGTTRSQGSVRSAWFRAVAASTGANTVTFALTSASDYGMVIFEASNPLATGAFDKTGGNNGNSATIDTTAAGVGIATAVADELIVACCTSALTSGTTTPANSPATWTDDQHNDSAAHMPYDFVYRGAGGGIGSGTTVDETYALSGGAVDFCAAIAAFEPAIGGGGGGLPLFLQGDALVGGMQAKAGGMQ